MSGNPHLQDFSLYIHVPFCLKKCPYCHFYSIPPRPGDLSLFVDCIIRDWQRFKHECSDKKLLSVYFGGGTPTLLPPDSVFRILEQISPPQGIEITLEANPESSSFDNMKSYRQAGINRVSVGVQSFDDALLQVLERRHTSSESARAVSAVFDAGITDISIDLMYDLPRQSPEIWSKTLQAAVSLPITHLSLYNLVIEPHTPFYKRRDEVAPLMPGDDVSAGLYSFARGFLKEHLFLQYEVSAFSLEGFRSVHNLGYWQGRPFIGLGPSAFSFWNGRRFQNVPNFSRYCRALREDRPTIDFEEKLDHDAGRRELLVIGLRVIDGVDIPSFEHSHGCLDAETTTTVEALIAEGLLDREGGCIKLTEKGLFFYDRVAAELI